MYHDRIQITRDGPEYDATPKTLKHDDRPNTPGTICKILISSFLTDECPPDTWIPVSEIHNFIGRTESKYNRTVDKTGSTRYALKQLVQEEYLERQGTTNDTKYKLIKPFEDPKDIRIQTIAKVHQALTPDTWKTSAQLSKELSIPPKTVQMALRQLKYDSRVTWRILFPLLNGHKTKIIEYQQMMY